MQDIKEFLDNLEEDGKHYAHFFSHPNYPGYYGIWMRERTPEYMKHWLPYSSLKGYSLVLSIEMHDTTFCDYMLELYPEQVEVSHLKVLSRIDDLSKTQEWINGFKAWKQNRIGLERKEFLQQYSERVWNRQKTNDKNVNK